MIDSYHVAFKWFIVDKLGVRNIESDVMLEGGGAI